MINELLQKGDFNVFCLDWSNGAILEPGSRESSYLQAVANTRVTGAIAAVFIDALTANAGVSYSDVYIIGLSLGAHVAGYAGERLLGLLGRITGLDPAGPAFEGTPSTVRLDASDAQFVDVIHTNGNKPMSSHAYCAQSGSVMLRSCRPRSQPEVIEAGRKCSFHMTKGNNMVLAMLGDSSSPSQMANRSTSGGLKFRV